MLGCRFVIFCFLFGLNRKSHRSRSPLRSLFNRRQAESNIKLALNIAEARRRKAKANLQFILENKSKICQSELIEPTLNLFYYDNRLQHQPL